MAVSACRNDAVLISMADQCEYIYGNHDHDCDHDRDSDLCACKSVHVCACMYTRTRARMYMHGWGCFLVKPHLGYVVSIQKWLCVLIQDAFELSTTKFGGVCKWHLSFSSQNENNCFWM